MSVNAEVYVDGEEVGSFFATQGDMGSVLLDSIYVGESALKTEGIVYVENFEVGTYLDIKTASDFPQILSAFKNKGRSTTVTLKSLALGDQDSVTGWFEESYQESNIDAIIEMRGASSLPLPSGVHIKLDGVACTLDPVREGDTLVTDKNVSYKVEYTQNHYLGKIFWFRECQLSLLPFENLTAESWTDSTVEDARYRTKVYLETYLNPQCLPACIIAYSKPNYPLTRVFKDKDVDLIFSIEEPETTPLVDSDHEIVGYEEKVPIFISTIDKGSVKGTKLKWQGETELRRVIETYPLGSLRTLERRRNADQKMSSTTLYCTEFILNYQRGIG